MVLTSSRLRQTTAASTQSRVSHHSPLTKTRVKANTVEIRLSRPRSARDVQPQPRQDSHKTEYDN